MADTSTPYVTFEPGQLITADGMNGMQTAVRADIGSQVTTVTEALKKSGVERADTADRFDGKTPTTWTALLDERYALKNEVERKDTYKRYYRRMDAEEGFLLLEHGLGRFPVVDVYDLLEVPPLTPPPSGTTPPPARFLLYYGHEELDRLQPAVTSKRLPRRTLGVPWETLLWEYHVFTKDDDRADDSLDDVINDFLDAFFAPPYGEEMEHMVSDWVTKRRERVTVGDLRKRGEWDDLRWLVLPRKLALGVTAAGPPVVEAIHLSYTTVALRATLPTGTTPPLDLMIVLRS